MISTQFKSSTGRLVVLLMTLVLVSGCTKTQDDVDLPVYDAIGGDFSLPSTLGKTLTLSDYKGKVVLINFGYTYCPDICPMVLSRLGGLSKQLSTQHSIDDLQLQVIFITVDPERDTIERLKDYLSFFGKEIIGVAGTDAQTLNIASSYSVFFEKVLEDGEESSSYQVAHSDKIFLLDKRGRLRALYGKADKDEKLISDIVDLAAAEI